jgi:hypothetical protein
VIITRYYLYFIAQCSLFINKLSCLDVAMWGALLLNILVGAAVASGPAFDGKPAAFVCTIRGGALIKPRIADRQVCSRVRRHVEKAYGGPLKPVMSPTDAARFKAGWVGVDLSFKKPGIASIVVTRSQRGNVRVSPEFSIAFSDRPIDERVVDMIAKHVSDHLVGKLNQ